MKILVAVKHVVDYNVKVRVNADGSGVETANVKHAINPFDDIAVEEAIRLKERGVASQVLVVSIGGDACQETLRKALAMGADRALLIQTDKELEPIHIAQVLQKVATDEDCQLAILGKQAIDNDCNQTGQMLAALLEWPQGTFASKLEFDNDKLKVTRELDGGLQTIAMSLSAVVTTDLRLNEPRYTTLPNIMKAKSKPLAVMPLAELGLSLDEHVQVLKVEPPTERQSGIKVNTINELLDILQQKQEVLA